MLTRTMRVAVQLFGVPGDILTRSVINSLFLPRQPFRSVPSLESLSLPLLSSLRATARLRNHNGSVRITFAMKRVHLTHTRLELVAFGFGIQCSAN